MGIIMNQEVYVNNVIEYIENRLTILNSSVEVSKYFHVSDLTLNSLFQGLIGYTVAEYIRYRRLYEAAVEISKTNDSILDISLRYGFDSLDGFTRAFKKFHKVKPSDLRRKNSNYKVFLPIRVECQLFGGDSMQLKVLNKYKMTFVGYKCIINFEKEQIELDEFWKSFFNKLNSNYGDTFSNSIIAIKEYGIGEYALRKKISNECFEYMIAGKYSGGNIPDGMDIYSTAENKYAIFDYFEGSNTIITNRIITKELQSINLKSEFEPIDDIVIEWFEECGNNKNDYRKAIWIPVKEKQDKNKNIIKNISLLTLVIILIFFFVKYFVFKTNNDFLNNSLDNINNNQDQNSYDPLISRTFYYKENIEPLYSVNVNNITYYSTDIDPTVSFYENGIFGEIGSFLGEFNLNQICEEYKDNSNNNCYAYQIVDIDMNFAIAVKCDDRLLTFINYDFEKKDWGSYSEALRLDKYMNHLYTIFLDEFGNPEQRGDRSIVYADNFDARVKDFYTLPCYNKDFDALFAKEDIPLVNIESDDLEKSSGSISGEALGKKTIRIIVDFWIADEWNYYIDIYDEGYIETNLGNNLKYFYIGKEAYETYIEKMEGYKKSFYEMELFYKEMELARERGD